MILKKKMVCNSVNKYMILKKFKPCIFNVAGYFLKGYYYNDGEPCN